VGLAVECADTVRCKSFAKGTDTLRGPTVALSSPALGGISSLR
jgi:hypothetical protein